MRLQQISTSRIGNWIIDNNQLYFEPGEQQGWIYPDDTTIQEITWWYKIISIMSGIEVKINWNDYKLVH